MPSFEGNSNTMTRKITRLHFPVFTYYLLTEQLCKLCLVTLVICTILIHVSFLDFNYLYERFIKFNETCKQLTNLDHITKRNLRYIMQQFRKQRAVLKNCLEESSTDNEK